MSGQYRDETRRIEQPPAGAPRKPVDLGPWVAGVGAALGVLWLVVGLVILARAGIPMDGALTEARAQVGPFSGNIITAVIAILAGAAFLTVGVQRQATTMFGLGLASGIFGLVWLIEPQAFGDILGINRATALIALTIGVISSALGGVASGTLFKGGGVR
jgi:hypothetical protein